MLSKREIRKKLLRIREKNKIDSSAVIAKIKDTIQYKDANSVLCYSAFRGEVCLDGIISAGKLILLPKMVDSHNFIPVVYDGFLQKNSFGILEPPGQAYTGNIDLALVPGIAFDKNCNRMGYGSGYYDNFLRNRRIYKIGVCFDFQVLPEIEHTQDDIPMDMVISESEIYLR